MTAQMFERGDWVEHERYGAGRFVRYDEANHLGSAYNAAANVAFAGSRWNFDVPDDEQDADFTLHGVFLRDLKHLTVTS